MKILITGSEGFRSKIVKILHNKKNQFIWLVKKIKTKSNYNIIKLDFQKNKTR